MQCSSVQFSQLNPEFRWDAEFYREEILTRLAQLQQKDHKRLGSLVGFIVGPFGSTITSDNYVLDSDYKYVRNKDIEDFFVKSDSLACIPDSIFNEHPQFHIRQDDLIFTVVGTLGKVAIARYECQKALFSCKSTLIRTKAINPYYLAAYLNSSTGRLFSLRGKRGAIQEGLNLGDLKEICVFVPSTSFQDEIESAVRVAFTANDESKTAYTIAESSLFQDLGLANWQPRHKLSFIANYREAQAAARIDAEYFQPKYAELVNAIRQYPGGFEHLGNLAVVRKQNFLPKAEQTYDYIELADIGGNGGITGCTRDEGMNLPSRARRKVKAGDVLVSSVEGSSSRIAIVGPEYHHALCSTGFYVLTPSALNAETLLLLLKSQVGQEQLKQGCRGTILTAINSDDFGRIVLPKVAPELQATIKDKVSESFRLRQKSKHLLDAARRAVELAIEQDEPTARKWLDAERAKA